MSEKSTNPELVKLTTSKLDRTSVETNKVIQPAVIRALQAIQRGEHEQQILERALGKALLLKMAGKDVDLIEVYKGLGGGDPIIEIVLESQVGDAFKEINVLPGIQAAREVAISDRVNIAADVNKKVTLQENLLATVPGQALSTLADLGGAEFNAKYKIDRISISR